MVRHDVYLCLDEGLSGAAKAIDGEEADRAEEGEHFEDLPLLHVPRVRPSLRRPRVQKLDDAYGGDVADE